MKKQKYMFSLKGWIDMVDKVGNVSEIGGIYLNVIATNEEEALKTAQSVAKRSCYIVDSAEPILEEEQYEK